MWRGYVCVTVQIPRRQGSAATQPQTATLLVLFACRSQGFHLLRLQRMQRLVCCSGSADVKSISLFAYLFLSIQRLA